VTIYHSPVEGRDSWLVKCSCLEWEARADSPDEAQRMARLHQKRPDHERGEPEVADEDLLAVAEANSLEYLERVEAGEVPARSAGKPKHESGLEPGEQEQVAAMEGGYYTRVREWTITCSCGWRGSTVRNDDPDSDEVFALEMEWKQHERSVTP